MAGKQERQRKLARDAHQRRMQRQAERARRARQLSVVTIVVVLVLGVAGLSAYIAGVFSAHKATAAANPSASPSVRASAPSATPSPSNTAAMVNGKCIYIKGGAAARKVKLPPTKPDTKATYVATVKTNRGTIVIDLLNSKAPCTVGSFASLAAQRFYDKTPCPRLTTSNGLYMLQCGDPTGTMGGGPGYAFGTENLTGATYTAGTLAMANAGTPDSNGSQFFIVYKNSSLPPSYTPFGKIVSGLNVLQKVAKHGFGPPLSAAGGGAPKESVEIDSVTIKKA